MPTLALLIWPFVTFVLFARLPRTHAIVWSVMLAYMFLPGSFSYDFTGLPPLDKQTVTVASLLIGLWLSKDRSAHRAVFANSEPRGLVNSNTRLTSMLIGILVLIFVSQIMTIATNTKPEVFGTRFLRDMRLWDLVSMISNLSLPVAMYFVGRRFIATPDGHRTLLRILVLGGLIYSLFMLFEVRMSPRLNEIIYGYSQHDFRQHIREGGYRPKVFMPHGLWVGFFIFSTIVAAFALFRAETAPDRQRYRLYGLVLVAILVMSKNLGATGLALVFVPILWLGSRWQMRVASIIAILFLFYPMVRQTNLVPLSGITALVSDISTERASSFQFRLDNEDILLDRAAEKPLFGWGTWGRSRVFDEKGTDLSIVDGLWILILGSYGWFGYIGYFALLTYPILLLRGASRRKTVPLETIALALIMVANLAYLIPNSALNPIGWLMAGALAGFVQFDAVKSETTAMTTSPRARKIGYTRFPTHARRSAGERGKSQTAVVSIP